MKKLTFILMLAVIASCDRNHRSDAYGNFETDEIMISSESSGRLLEMNVEEGISYPDGVLVGVVDSTGLHLQKLQLISKKEAVGSRLVTIRSQSEVQQQQLENLMTDMRRLEKLFADGAATQKQMDDIRGAISLAEKQLEATQAQAVGVRAEMAATDAQIRQVEEMISKCTIVNPIEGTVLSKYAFRGEIVAPGKPLYKIASLDTLNLKVYVSGAQLPYLEIGKEVEVLVDSSDAGFTRLSGRVSWISPEAEFTPKTIQTKEERVRLVYAARVRVANDGSLKIGMPGEINFMPEPSENK